MTKGCHTGNPQVAGIESIWRWGSVSENADQYTGLVGDVAPLHPEHQPRMRLAVCGRCWKMDTREVAAQGRAGKHASYGVGYRTAPGPVTGSGPGQWLS